MHPGNMANGPHFQEVARVVCSCWEDKLGANGDSKAKKKALASPAKGATP